MASIPGAAGPGAGFPQWTYNTFTHQISQVTNAASKALAEAVSFPTTIIFFTSDAAAQAYAKAQGGGTDVSNNPVVGATNAATGTVASAATGTASGIHEIGVVAQILTEGNTWIRVMKVIVGSALLMIGIAHISGADNAIAKAARSIPIIPV